QRSSSAAATPRPSSAATTAATTSDVSRRFPVLGPRPCPNANHASTTASCTPFPSTPSPTTTTYKWQSGGYIGNVHTADPEHGQHAHAVHPSTDPSEQA